MSTTTAHSFEIIALSPAGFPDPRLAAAGFHAGVTGGIALEHLGAAESSNCLAALAAVAPEFAVSTDGDCSVLEEFAGRGLKTVILTGGSPRSNGISRLRDAGVRVIVEAVSAAEVQQAVTLGADAVVVKGNEGGGRVGEETTFILLQQVFGKAGIPVFARGGIGLYTAAAALAAGAAGVILDWQLALLEESGLPEIVKSKIGRMDGSETAILGQNCGAPFRAYSKPDEKAFHKLRDLEAEQSLSANSAAEKLEGWKREIAARIAARELLAIGQDAAFAASLADEHRTLSGVCAAIRRNAFRQLRVAARKEPLRAGGPLAVAHGTKYPILQGPMTRVSDRADFAHAVARDGGLPFLALALMRGEQAGKLLVETKEKIGALPWGVGILGFVPAELREEQLAEVAKHKPPFAVIAGGRPDMAKRMEQDGTVTYLHVPSPALLRDFVERGARRVIFEGRECGGHVGPRASTVLWESMIRVILGHLEAPGAGRPEEYHIVLAGGIHNRLSAAMASAITSPLVERGVRVGVLLGTGYLFTEEAVATGAITSGFQREALRCERTVLVESGVGHATRCSETPFVELFESEKRRLRSEGRSKEETREALERLNLGRLRIASKGVDRRTLPDGQTVYEKIGDEQQQREGMYMIGQVAALRSSVTTIKALHEDVSRAGEMLRERLDSLSRPAMSGRASRSADVAIVGWSAVLPGANNADSYWQNILHKRNCVTEVSKERWDIDVYFNPDRRAKDQIYSKWGGFINDFAFDPFRFGMPPNTLRSIEPMQLIMLEMVHRALADANYLLRPFNKQETACIVGTGGGVAELGQGYGFRSMLPHFIDRAGGTLADSAALIDKMSEHLPEWTEDSFAGLLLNVVSGRVANRFDLGGTNYIVDAACATALAALRNACAELESRSSEVVIAASADSMQTAFGYLCFSKTQALSPTGQCRAFDETADGIVISEGFIVAVLKRLDDAIMDGDRVYAIIKGVGASSDGKDKGLTAPRPAGQLRALERAYEKAGVDPATIGLVEAHGTGTAVGDRSEAEALTTFFSRSGAPKQSIALGSVKSMIGHTKCSAGFAGLVKAALALQHKVLPPTIGVTKPNSKAKLDDSVVYVNTEARPWLRRLDGAPRRAAVSAFGFGGTNFHVVLEEYVSEAPEAEPLGLREWPAELVLFRGANSSSVASPVNVIVEALASGSRPDLCELASAVYREHGSSDGPVCLAVVATSLDDLAEKLRRARAAVDGGQKLRDPSGIYFSPAADRLEGEIAFLFPGQGSQRTNMLRDLANVFPQVRRVFEQADAALLEQLGNSLSSFVFPVPEFSEEEKKKNEERLKATRVAQPALGAADLAMFSLLASLGIHPAMAAGHSYGEFAALAAAGAMGLDDLIRISEVRGRVIVDSAQGELGGMAAVDGNEAQTRAALDGAPEVWIANLNSPQQTVIAGTRRGIEGAIESLRGAGMNARPIPVACAFHSELVAGAKAPLAAALGQFEWRRPRFPVYSNTLAQPHPENPAAVRDLLVEHLVRPVRFADEISAMYEAGARVFIECGPGGVLGKLAASILAGKPHTVAQLDHPGKHGLVQLMHALGQMAAAGVPFFGGQLFQGRAQKRLRLAELLRQSKPSELPDSHWVIRQGRAFPAAEHRKVVAMGGVTYGNDAGRKAPIHTLVKSGGDASSATAASAPISEGKFREVAMGDQNETTVGRQPDVVSTKSISVELEPIAPDGTILEQALQGHHRLMARFLDTHRMVMGALLNNGDLRSELSAQPITTPRVVARATVPKPAPAPIAAASVWPPAAAPVAKAVAPEGAAALSVPPLPAAAPVPASAVAPAPVVSAHTAAPAATAEVKPSAAPVKLTRALITERLLALVAERTGYPPDMLGLDLDLEADLGVDSIKRVEILAAVQKESLVPAAAMENDIETLAKLSTLGKIIHYIESRANEIGDDSPPAPQAPMEAAAASTRMTVQVEPAPAQEDQSLPFAQAVLITHDGHGVAQLIAKKFEACRVPARVIRHAGELDAARQALGPVSHVVHLAPLADNSGDPVEDVLNRFETDVTLLYEITRNCAGDLRSKPGAMVISASRMDGAFGFGGGAPAFSPANGGAAGFLKTVSREWTGVRARALDFERTATPEEIAGAIWFELRVNDGRSEVGYRGGRRIALASRKSPILKQRAEIQMDSGSIFLLTGGARGITAEIALELAGAFRPKLVLVGRSPLPGPEALEFRNARTEGEIKAVIIDRMRTTGQRPTPALIQGECQRVKQAREIAANLAALRAAGAGVEYHAADVCDEQAFGAVIDRVYAEHGRIDAVVHGAGVIEDKLIEDKTPQSFARVVAPKVKGAQILARKLRPESLRFLAFFSSVSARYGNRGQCDYAAANEVLNKLALTLNHRWPGRVVSLDWGPWRTEGGMVSPELAARFAAAGVEMVETASGRKSFLEEIVFGPKTDAEVVFGGPLTIETQNPLKAGATREDGPATAAASIELSTAVDKYLMDHVIDGRPVLPMAMALELMAQHASKAWAGEPVRVLRDVHPLKGVVFDAAGGSRTLQFEGARTAPGRVVCKLMSADRQIVHYSSTVEFGNAAAPAIESLKLIAPQPLPVGIEEAYDSWLFHGPLFAGISSIESMGRNGIIGTLRTVPAPKLFADGRSISWITDPVLIDSGLQMIILWSKVYLNAMVLPARLDAFHRYAPLSVDGPVRCEIEIAGDSSSPEIMNQLRFYDSRGALLAWMENMRVIASKGLNRLFKAKGAATR